MQFQAIKEKQEKIIPKMEVVNWEKFAGVRVNVSMIKIKESLLVSYNRGDNTNDHN